MTSPTRRADRWWSAAAPAYDRCVGLVGWHTAQDSLVADLGGGTVLEVGCGPAHLAGPLLARGVGYVGLDRNPAMLARAARSVAASGRSADLVVRGDVRALPFAARSFDCVVATGVLGLLDAADRGAALREISRVTRGEVRLLEPVRRPGSAPRIVRSRALAFARGRPIELGELAAAGLTAELRGPAVLAGVYSAVYAHRR
jgi:ubiquinone/menaquinone biosynthesis C-methylase UbiE